jgi:hypothetical protein
MGKIHLTNDLYLYLEKRKRPFNAVWTGALQPEIKETRRAFFALRC